MEKNISSMKITLEDCPINGIRASELLMMMKETLKKEHGKPKDNLVLTGPQIIEALLKHNKKHASAIIWSLMNAGVNTLLAGAKKDRIEGMLEKIIEEVSNPAKKETTQ